MRPVVSMMETVQTAEGELEGGMVAIFGGGAGEGLKVVVVVRDEGVELGGEVQLMSFSSGTAKVRGCTKDVGLGIVSCSSPA